MDVQTSRQINRWYLGLSHLKTDSADVNKKLTATCNIVKIVISVNLL